MLTIPEIATRRNIKMQEGLHPDYIFMNISKYREFLMDSNVNYSHLPIHTIFGMRLIISESIDGYELYSKDEYIPNELKDEIMIEEL